MLEEDGSARKRGYIKTCLKKEGSARTTRLRKRDQQGQENARDRNWLWPFYILQEHKEPKAESWHTSCYS